MKTHRQVIAFIRTIRESFPDAAIVYQYGACYGFFTILKSVYPNAQCYFTDSEQDHVITKIQNRFYDIKGEYPFRFTKLSEIVKLTEKDHARWVGVASGQRLELMLAKYASQIKKIENE